MTLTHVFTYGSLMFTNIFEGVTGERCGRQKATLQQWSRNALLNKTYPGAMPSLDPLAQIDGVLWLQVSDKALKNLDIFEGDDYSREWVTVLTENGTSQNAWVYRWIEESLLCGAWDAAAFARRHQEDFVANHWQKPKESTP